VKRPEAAGDRVPASHTVRRASACARTAAQSLALIRQSTMDHARIARAIAARDADRAAKEMVVHLDHIEETRGGP
jgi:DNA-binding FadR family transcriptional regulator